MTERKVLNKLFDGNLTRRDFLKKSGLIAAAAALTACSPAPISPQEKPSFAPRFEILPFDFRLSAFVEGEIPADQQYIYVEFENLPPTFEKDNLEVNIAGALTLTYPGLVLSENAIGVYSSASAAISAAEAATLILRGVLLPTAVVNSQMTGGIQALIEGPQMMPIKNADNKLIGFRSVDTTHGKIIVKETILVKDATAVKNISQTDKSKTGEIYFAETTLEQDLNEGLQYIPEELRKAIDELNQQLPENNDLNKKDKVRVVKGRNKNDQQALPYLDYSKSDVKPEQIQKLAELARKLGYRLELHVGPYTLPDPYIQAARNDAKGKTLVISVDSDKLLRPDDLYFVENSLPIPSTVSEKLPNGSLVMHFSTGIETLPINLKFDAARIIAPQPLQQANIAKETAQRIKPNGTVEMAVDPENVDLTISRELNIDIKSLTNSQIKEKYPEAITKSLTNAGLKPNDFEITVERFDSVPEYMNAHGYTYSVFLNNQFTMDGFTGINNQGFFTVLIQPK